MSDYPYDCDTAYEYTLFLRVRELEAAARDLLEYAKDNVPFGECYSRLGPHPIDVMEKLLK